MNVLRVKGSGVPKSSTDFKARSAIKSTFQDEDEAPAPQRGEKRTVEAAVVGMDVDRRLEGPVDDPKKVPRARK
jgi:hypothetical protein